VTHLKYLIGHGKACHCGCGHVSRDVLRVLLAGAHELTTGKNVYDTYIVQISVYICMYWLHLWYYFLVSTNCRQARMCIIWIYICTHVYIHVHRHIRIYVQICASGVAYWCQRSNDRQECVLCIYVCIDYLLCVKLCMYMCVYIYIINICCLLVPMKCLTRGRNIYYVYMDVLYICI